MCGLAGIVDPRGVDGAAVARMAEALAHRGPDDATVHLEPGFGVGFRRLSVIDLETGAQPLANEDGSIRVVCNGEIYNYMELRDRLLEAGHRFRSRSDTEVLVHLYEERGAGLVEQLRGMFAFAIWDRPARRLLLGRDHLGQKPLFWARTGPRFYFASEIKAILAVAPEFRAVHAAALDEYLSLRVISEPRSMFEGVHKLGAAHLLELDAGEAPRTRRYWRLRFQPKRRLPENEAVERLDELLTETVRLHLVSDVPVGAFLSGGVDSGLITAMMAGEASGPLDTFSVGVPYGNYDETPAARAVARRFGTRHHESTIDGSLAACLPRLVFHADEPSDPLSACSYHLARVAREHVKVAVGGDGGDELFGGYDRYYGVPWVRHYAALPEAFRRSVLDRLLRLMPEGRWYKSLAHRLRWAHELATVEGGRRYARSLGYFYFTPRRRAEVYSERFQRLVAGFDPEASLIAWHDDSGLEEALDRMLLADAMVRLPNHSVMILDRMTMAHGLEARSPFLDHRLAEFAASLPPDLKVRGRSRRRVEMLLARKYLPREILRRPKQGFSSALPYLMKRQFEALFGGFLPDSHLVRDGWLRRPPIQAMLDGHLAGRADHGNRLWLLLNAELWHRLHIEQRSIEELEARVSELLGPSDRAGGAGSPSAALAV
ncbi:MAG: asparagine synthase (glutamine-hydrolyzing) [Gemmatimonadota bacterium]